MFCSSTDHYHVAGVNIAFKRNNTIFFTVDFAGGRVSFPRSRLLCTKETMHLRIIYAARSTNVEINIIRVDCNAHVRFGNVKVCG